jgi:DNA-binding CsgD family transcriptional regulator
MTQNNAHSNTMPSLPRYDNAAEELSRHQSEFMSEARRRAIDDVLMADQLSEPLAALLLYLHEIKRASERFIGTEIAPASVREIVNMALLETERVCDIIRRVGHTGEKPVAANAAVTRGRAEAIDARAWTGETGAEVSAPSAHPRANGNLLTPREHEVLALITGGASNKEGGHRLGISTRTFEAHRAHLMGKLGAKNAADLIRKTLNFEQ